VSFSSAHCSRLEIAGRTGWLAGTCFPLATEGGGTLIAGFPDGTYLIGIRRSVRRLLEGYFIAAVVGSLSVASRTCPLAQGNIGLIVMGCSAA